MRVVYIIWYLQNTNTLALIFLTWELAHLYFVGTINDDLVDLTEKFCDVPTIS
jgi:hypothetical protein